MHKPIHVNCPTCKTQITWSDEFKFRPFCSERCRLIDLGEWASETRKIAGTAIIDENSEEFEAILQALSEQESNTQQ